MLRSEIAFEVTGDGRLATATMTMRCSGHGDPVSVEVPTEAFVHQWQTGCPGS